MSERMHGKMIDEVRQLAKYASDGSMLPVEFGQRVLRKCQIETPHGRQSLFYLTPTAQKTDYRYPTAPMTTLDKDVSYTTTPRLFFPNDHGSYRLIVRVTGDPIVGAFPVAGDPNVPAHRLRVGGAGLTNNNVHLFERTSGGWIYDKTGGVKFVMQPPSIDYMHEHPDRIAGWQEVVLNNGNILPLPGALLQTDYYSPQGVETIARVPVTYGMVQAQALGNIVLPLPFRPDA